MVRNVNAYFLFTFSRFFILVLTGIIFLTLFLFPIVSSAHGSIHEKIEYVSKKIKQDPGNPENYLIRASYYRLDEDFKKSIKDIEKAKSLDPGLKSLDVHYAMTYEAFEQFQKALFHINRFLDKNPEDSSALIIRAGIHIKMCEDQLAAMDFKAATTGKITPQPQHYIDIANAILAADEENTSEAFLWLDKGEQKFNGFNIIISSHKVDLAEKIKDYKKAVTEIDRIIHQLPRDEIWLVRKGKIYELARQPEEAIIQYQLAKEAISALPIRARSTSKIKKLESKINLKLTELSIKN